MDICDHISLYTNMKRSKKPGIVTYVYNPNDGEAEHEDPWDLLCS